MENYAYWNIDTGEWDVANAFDEGIDTLRDPWVAKDERRKINDEIEEIWEKIPEQNRATLDITAFLNYENILEIDEHGDEFFDGPHIYCLWKDGRPKFDGVAAEMFVRPIYKEVEGKPTQISDRQNLDNPPLEKRIEFFPKKFRRQIAVKPETS